MSGARRGARWVPSGNEGSVQHVPAAVGGRPGQCARRRRRAVATLQERRSSLTPVSDRRRTAHPDRVALGQKVRHGRSVSAFQVPSTRCFVAPLAAAGRQRATKPAVPSLTRELRYERNRPRAARHGSCSSDTHPGRTSSDAHASARWKERDEPLRDASGVAALQVGGRSGMAAPLTPWSEPSDIACA
jgi:hypothetical protein